SIAGLYLGPSHRPVTGATLPDPQAHRRSDYARAKAECDRVLINLHASEGLPVCILRPGVVVGEGGIANHGALGIFNNEQHCIGWNSGHNPCLLFSWKMWPKRCFSPALIRTPLAIAITSSETCVSALANTYVNWAGNWADRFVIT